MAESGLRRDPAGATAQSCPALRHAGTWQWVPTACIWGQQEDFYFQFYLASWPCLPRGRSPREDLGQLASVTQTWPSPSKLPNSPDLSFALGSRWPAIQGPLSKSILSPNLHVDSEGSEVTGGCSVCRSPAPSSSYMHIHMYTCTHTHRHTPQSHPT